METRPAMTKGKVGGFVPPQREGEKERITRGEITHMNRIESLETISNVHMLMLILMYATWRAAHKSVAKALRRQLRAHLAMRACRAWRAK